MKHEEVAGEQEEEEEGLLYDDDDDAGICSPFDRLTNANSINGPCPRLDDDEEEEEVDVRALRNRV